VNLLSVPAVKIMKIYKRKMAAAAIVDGRHLEKSENRHISALV